MSIVGIGLSLSITLVAIDLAQMGYGGMAVGLNVAAAGLATLVGAPFVPFAARRLGTKRLLLAALALSILCLALFPVFPTYGAWLVLRAVYSLALTILFILSEYWINTVTPPRQRGAVLGLYGMSLAAGFAAGPALLAGTGADGSKAFGMAIALFVLAGVPILGGGDVPDIRSSPARGSRLAMLRAAPLSLLAAALHGALETSGLGLLAVVALRAGATPLVGAALVGLFAAGNIALQVPIGLLSDRIDRTRLLFAIAAFGCVGALALAALPVGGPAFRTVLFLWGGLVGSFYAIGLAQIGARFEGDDLASANSAFVTFYAMGMLVGPPLVGAALNAMPSGGFFVATAAMIGMFGLAAGRACLTDRSSGPLSIRR